ncbi:MAG: YggT family protein [Candidatus Omnitrophica bacterium]|nr:YggT family protein [Candidatus Omnitrophota bacterium]
MALAYLVSAVCTILTWLLVARIVISWFPVDPYHSIVQFLYQVTDPILVPFRKLPLRIGMLDLSPIIAFMVIFFVRNVLVGIFRGIAIQFGTV